MKQTETPLRIHVQQVNVPLLYNETLILQRIARKVGCDTALLSHPKVIRRSLDARPRNPEPVYALTVEVDLASDSLPKTAPLSAISPVESTAGQPIPVSDPKPHSSPPPRHSPPSRPVIVGAGPAGLLAAYQLALAGARPLLIERGEDAAARAPKVAGFWNSGILDPESNVLFGEGGAGLFSDGKLTARSKERGRIRMFMELLHACGADDSVLIDAEPHVGSDALLQIVPRLRERIIAAGGEVRFNARLESLVIKAGQLQAVVVNGQDIACQHCVLAVGHSARDVYTMLSNKGVTLHPKPFAVGVRLEIPQAGIDRAQYGRFAGNPLLGAASFRLTRREENGIRACYSFCMCPGGKVISCASEPGFLTTNGMSYSKRTLPRGNAAFLVPVGPADYPEHAIPALAGMEFQRKLERVAFSMAGANYHVPAIRLVDFLTRKVQDSLPEGRSCVQARPVEFRNLFPEFIIRTLENTLPAMLKELNGIKLEDALLYAPETRSSSPLWIARNPEGESINTRGLFPVGEGAGYAGGIVSSALDGMRAAERLVAYREP